MTEVLAARGRRKTRVGVVVSDKMDKTVVVEVGRTVLHAVYKKYLRRRKRFMVHDEENRCRIGDHVLIVETRPLSRNKNWRVRKVLKEAALPGGGA
jgi:small subunit ribosomal protein S17